MKGNNDKDRSWLVFTYVILAILALGLVQWLWMLQASTFHTDGAALAELGSIMGAVFTAGGILVALIALYSLASIERTTQQAAQKVVDSLPKLINERLYRHTRAYDRYRLAQGVFEHFGFSEMNWVEAHVEASLRLDPE